VYSKSLEDHISHLDIVIQCLVTNNFVLKRNKCLFAQESIEYLGHIISRDGVGPDPENIRAMIAWPTPSTIKQLRGFLGLTGFYQKFVQHYASIAAPLTNLLKRDSFTWSEKAQRSFEQLKDAKTNAPVLMLRNFQEDFTIETDASGQGMGVVLMQNNHPICYFSKKIFPKLLSASTYVRELHAITAVVKKWRTYLLGRKFIIHTDQRSLRELMMQVVQTPEQQYYLSKLLGYTYEIVYKPGATNKVDDALSRIDGSSSQMMGLTVPQCDLVSKIQETYNADPELKQLYQKVFGCLEEHSGFIIVKGIILYHDKIYIPCTSPLKQVLLEEFHVTPMAGHAGIHRTYGRLSDNFFWKGMKKDVAEFVKGCVICR